MQRLKNARFQKKIGTDDTRNQSTIFHSSGIRKAATSLLTALPLTPYGFDSKTEFRDDLPLIRSFAESQPLKCPLLRSFRRLTLHCGKGGKRPMCWGVDFAGSSTFSLRLDPTGLLLDPADT